MVTNWQFVGNYTYKCFVQGFQSESSNTFIDGIEGEHLEAKTIDDVDAVDFYQQQCRYLPKGLAKFFKNLVGLSVWESGLESISKDDLRPFPNLKILWLFGNRLMVIQPLLLIHNRKIKFLDFSENRIRSVAPDFFDPLVDLEKIYFPSNICYSGNAEGQNNIKEIERKLIQNCPFEEKPIESQTTANFCGDDNKIAQLVMENSSLKEVIEKIQENQTKELATFSKKVNEDIADVKNEIQNLQNLINKMFSQPYEMSLIG